MKTLRLVLIPALLSLAACSGDELTRTFGLTRDAPDGVPGDDPSTVVHAG